jgi:cytochrome c biogenesis protein CcmG/thiol:disulfide interchange protein DsbE
LILRKSLWVFALSALLVTSCSSTRTVSASAKSEKDRKPAADFTLKDSNGASVKLSDYRGKVVLLNFWATWCGPCQLEIPWFEEFEQQYKSQGFAVLGVSMDEDGWGVVKPYIAEHKVNYRVLLGDDSVTQLYGGVESLPTSFIIDREGKIAFAPHIGLIQKNEYVNEIQSLLENKQTSVRPIRAALPAALLTGAAK